MMDIGKKLKNLRIRNDLTLEELEKHLSITTNGIDQLKAKRITERIRQLTNSIELVSKNRRD